MFVANTTFIVLYTAKVVETESFYRSIGANITELNSDKVVVKLGDYDLHFVLNTSEPFDEYEYATEPPYGQGALYYLGTDQISKVYDLINAHSPKTTPIMPNHWGTSEFLFEDPNGYKFVVYEE